MGAPLLAVLVASVLLAALARRYDVSAPLGLVVAGLAVGLIPGVPAIEMQPQLVMFVVLPPLLWSAGLESSYLALRKNVRPIGLLAVGLPRSETVPYIAASLTIHVGYYIALAGAYQHGEFGVTYPIMRGFAPMLVALGSLPFLGEAPSAAAWAGIAGVTVGVGLVGLSHPGEALHHGKAMVTSNAGMFGTLPDGVTTRVPAGNAAALAQALLPLIESAAIRQAAGARARAFGDIMGNWKDMALATMDIYRQVLRA